jgi:hypothetical protein
MDRGWMDHSCVKVASTTEDWGVIEATTSPVSEVCGFSVL